VSRPAPGRGAAICFVTDRAATGGRPLVEVAAAAIAAGVARVQVREKDLDGGPLLRLVRDIQEAAKAAGRCQVIVNDRLDVALAARAAGVHLPAEGLPIGAVRARASRRFLIGRSVHSLAEAQKARKEGADYLILGPIFPTPSKAAFGEPLGLDTLRRVIDAVPLPIWAIGGINGSTAAGLRGVPIAGVCAISAIAAAPEPAAGVRAIAAALAC